MAEVLRGIHCGVKFPNTAESDKLPKVWHVLGASNDERYEIYEKDPLTALEKFNEMVKSKIGKTNCRFSNWLEIESLKPISNPIKTSINFNSRRFGKSKEEIEYISKIDGRNVWSLHMIGVALFAKSGVDLRNADGFVVCALPYVGLNTGEIIVLN